MTQKKEKHLVRGKIWVTRQYKKGTPEIGGQEDLEVQAFDVEPASVTAAYGLTLNTGNFNSARCDARVTLPCYAEEIDEAFMRAWEIAEFHVKEQTKKIRSNS